MRARLVLILLFFPSLLVSQQGWEFDNNAEKRFTIAVKKFSIGEFSDAAVDFEYLTKLTPHHRTTAAYVMLGKAYFRAQDLRESIRILKHFIDTYPQSLYVDDAHYTLGLNYEAQKRYDDALLQFLAAVETTGDSKLRKNALYYAELIATEKLTVAVLTDLLRGLHLPEGEDYVRIKLAEKHLAAGNVGLAEEVLKPVVQRTELTAQYPRAESLLQQIRRGVNVRIGVLLPLMTRATQKHPKTYGEEILQGMQFALEELRQSRQSPIEITLEVRDTERDPTLAARYTQELSEDQHVIAIVGPIFNNEAIASAGIANAKQVPLITPTASIDGLTEIGPYIFQLSPNVSTRGKAAAQYAVSVLGLTTLAVIAPNDGNGKTMAAAFTHEALNLGARVVATEWYPPRATDLREQLIKIRRVSLNEADPLISFASNIHPSDVMRMVELGVPPRTIDSLMNRGGTMSVYQLFGPDGKRIADSLRLQTFIPQGIVDSLDKPAAGIQGTYMPINDPQEIAILTSQLAYFNIETQMLGSSEWYSTLELDANRRYANGVIFLSDFYVDTKDVTYAMFAKRWSDRTKKKVTTNAVLGYDLIQCIASVIYAGTTSREAVARAVASIEDLPLLHGMATLSKNRVANDFHVLQFRSGEVTKIGSLSAR